MSPAIQFPPESIEQLRLLSKQLQSGEINLPIGRKIFEALLKMLEQPEQMAVSTIVEISQQLAISPASITRLTKLLGFSGFNAFQKLFKQANARPTDFYSDNLRHLINSKTGNDKVNTASFLQQQAQMVCAALTQLSHPEQVEKVAEEMEKAASMLVSRRRIYIFGARQASTVANMMRYGLSLLRGNVHMLSQAEQGVAMSVLQLRKEDVLVLISAAPYSPITLKIAAIAAKQQCQILALTDSDHSPLTDAATVSLTIPSVDHFYVNSQLLNCFFVENLLNTAAALVGKPAMDNIRRYEILLQEFQSAT